MARLPSGTDLDGLNDGQLRDLIQNAKAALAERIQARLDEFKAMAREARFEVSIHRVGKAAMPGRNRRRAGGQAVVGDGRGPVVPKYRNPKNAAQTWAGRGMKPKWLEQELAGGAKLEDFLINEPSGAARGISGGPLRYRRVRAQARQDPSSAPNRSWRARSARGSASEGGSGRSVSPSRAWWPAGIGS